MNILSLAGRAMMLGILGLSPSILAQSSFTSLAGEYSLIGAQAGDQMYNSISLNTNGGWIVWQDNITDGDGWGISARRLNNSFSGDLNIFRVNQIGVGEQERPKVSMLNNGGAVFAWQGGKNNAQIYARFMSSLMTFQSGDILVNTYTNQPHARPSVAVLAGGNVAVVWQSYRQDGSHFGVYGQMLSSSGTRVGNEFRINQLTALNQRDCVVAPLTNGNFIAAWASERSTAVADTNNPASQYKVDIKGRLFGPTGVAIDNEFTIAQGGLCANPSLVGLPDGGFFCSWSQIDAVNTANKWDVMCAAFNAQGIAVQNAALVNSTTLGGQAGPQVTICGNEVFCVWTSLEGQDSSREGVYGRRISFSGAPLGSEILVNTETRNGQIHPSVAGDGAGHVVVAWSSFTGLSTLCDLFAQRFTAGGQSALLPPPAPYVFPLSANSLNVTWAEVSGYPIAFYEVHMDGSASPIVVSNSIQTTVANLTANTTYTFRLLYQLTNGLRSSLSSPATGMTWGADNNSDGLPDNWQSGIWGANASNWPLPQADSDGDGASNLMEFLAGTSPTDANSVLRSFLTRTESGMTFSWKTQPGMVYQLQSATALDNWQNTGLPRFAHGYEDSVLFPIGSQGTFYRVIRLR